jgi:CubicO group peptidase (beta-lactamase class C family)
VLNNNIPIHGYSSDAFSKVRDVFVSNFKEMGEIGARVSIIQKGEIVLDLWGGYVTEDCSREWNESTLVNTMSISKGIAAIAAHLLADRGMLDYDAEVNKYWPEFSQNGKEHITVRQLLSHQASLAVIDSAQQGDILDWQLFTSKIAEQAPNWPPGTQQTYHAITYGFLVGELIERIDGRPVKEFIKQELTEPLEADYIIGCNDKELKRVEIPILNPHSEMMAGGGLVNENSMKQFSALPADPNFFRTPAHWKSIIPSSSGVTNSNGIARIFAPLACNGSFNGVNLLKQSTIKAMSEEQWHANDYHFGNDFRVTMGLLLNLNFNFFGREGNIGSAGAGGYTGFADPVNELSFGYTPIRYTSGEGLGDEPRRIIEALYECI